MIIVNSHDAGVIFNKIVNDVLNDPEVQKQAEEEQRLYGTLTEEDLKMRFTI